MPQTMEKIYMEGHYLWSVLNMNDVKKWLIQVTRNN